MEKEKIIKKIHTQYIKKLKNLDVSNKKLVICFSGIAGSGKTYIAKILEEKYKGVKIRNDDIREIILKIKKTRENLDKFTYDYKRWFLQNYKFKNKLIILDSGIDRGYEEIFSFFKERSYKIFIIRLDVLEKVSEQRIKNELGKLDDNYINRHKKWFEEWREFGKKVKSDILIKNNKDNKLNLNFLFKKLNKLIA